MKKRSLIIIGIIVLLVMSITSCQWLLDLILGEESGVTITERINQFETTLNDADRTVETFKSHLHPTLMQQYNQIDSDTIELGPLGKTHANFTIGEPSIVDDVATCSFESADTSGTIVFEMALYESDYMIKKITLTLASDPTNPEVLLKVIRA